jgi:hypothetical protein
VPGDVLDGLTNRKAMVISGLSHQRRKLQSNWLHRMTRKWWRLQSGGDTSKPLSWESEEWIDASWGNPKSAAKVASRA